jgi:hypothetical protein
MFCWCAECAQFLYELPFVKTVRFRGARRLLPLLMTMKFYATTE